MARPGRTGEKMLAEPPPAASLNADVGEELRLALVCPSRSSRLSRMATRLATDRHEKCGLEAGSHSGGFDELLG